MLARGEQGSPPIALDPITLETKGVVPWSTQLSRGMHEPACFGDAAFTAHPKWDPDTGELYGWAYSDEQPYVTLHWVKPDGSVRSRELWDAPYASLTARHLADAELRRAARSSRSIVGARADRGRARLSSAGTPTCRSCSR